MKTKPETALTWRLPLRLAPLQNTYARMHWSKRRMLKEACLLMLMKQHGRAKEPLRGKPALWVCRCSSMPCDWDSGYGAKLPLDCLVDLGFLRGDGPNDVDVCLTWAPSRPRAGELVIQAVTRPVLDARFEEAQGWT